MMPAISLGLGILTMENKKNVTLYMSMYIVEQHNDHW